jgi:HemY protein
MIKLLWRFGLLALLAAGFAWLADRPGTLTIRWLGREISMSFIAGVAFAVVTVFVLWFLWGLFSRLWHSPQAVSRFWSFRKNRKGYESLSRGIIAAGAGDAAAAAKHAAVAGNALADEPLVNVLAAQAAQLKGDRAAVKRIFEAMTKSPDTEALGLRGLFAEARQSGDVAAARRYAERALALNPRLAWASTAVLQLQSSARDWSAASQTVAQQIKSGLLAGPEGNRKHAALLAAQAMALEDGNRAQALDLALKAHKLDPSLVPAAAVAARLLIRQASQRKAAKLLRETWILSPHPELAEIYSTMIPEEGPDGRFERVRELLREHKGGLEGAVALARAAVKAQRWEAAREALKQYVDDRPQARICALMADIEEASGDKGRAREWLARALRAPRDPIWVSDGVASPRWTPVSPVSGDIVPCEWKAPFEMPDVPEAELTGPAFSNIANVAAPPVAASAASPAAPAEPVRVIEPPRMVTPQRPPDDPGLPEDFDTPPGAPRKSLPADG